jgi:hypothetical protein
MKPAARLLLPAAETVELEKNACTLPAVSPAKLACRLRKSQRNRFIRTELLELPV